MNYTTQQIIDEIANSSKKTPVQVWLKGDFHPSDFEKLEFYQGKGLLDHICTMVYYGTMDTRLINLEFNIFVLKQIAEIPPFPF